MLKGLKCATPSWEGDGEIYELLLADDDGHLVFKAACTERLTALEMGRKLIERTNGRRSVVMRTTDTHTEYLHRAEG